MKKISLFLFFVLSTSYAGFSQVSFATGAVFNTVFDNTFGVQVRADIPVAETLSVAPKLTYFLISDITTLKFDTNVHINITTVGDGIDIYGLAGPNLLFLSGFGQSDSEFGVELGGGVKVNRFYGEIRYWKILCEDCVSEIEFGAGIYF